MEDGAVKEKQGFCLMLKDCPLAAANEWFCVIDYELCRGENDTLSL